jgi:methyl-accepting chemotaxis protein
LATSALERFRNLRSKILGLLGLGILTVGLIAIVSFSVLSARIADYDHLMKSEVTANTLADRINFNFKRQVQEWKNVLLRGSVEKDRLKYWDRFRELHNTIQSEADEFLALDLDDASLSSMRDFQRAHESLLPRYEAGYTAFIENNFSHIAGDSAVRGIDREPTQSLADLSARLQSDVIRISGEKSGAASHAVLFGTIAIVLAMVVSVLTILRFMESQVVGPLTLLIDHLREVSKGNYESQLTFDRADEIGRMSQAVEQLRVNLKSICEELSHYQVDLDGLSQTLIVGTDQVSTSSHHLSQTARAVASSAVSASDSASSAERLTQECATLMNDTVEVIRGSSEQIRESSLVIDNLATDIAKVQQALEVITSIANQTNLLALNAATEAARAGEQGRGFSVVADEVRSLAAKTRQSTDEIRAVIEAVTAGAQNAVSAIEQGRSATEIGVQQVLQADKSLAQIREAVREVNQINGEMRDHVSEQLHHIDTIVANMDSVNAVAREGDADQTSSTLAGVRERMADAIDRLMGRARR